MPHVATGPYGRQNRCWRRSEEASMSTDPDIQWNAPVEEVLTARQGALGRIRLNRPRPINALTLEMIEAIHQTLRDFGQDESITAVALDGAGEIGRASCREREEYDVVAKALENKDRKQLNDKHAQREDH